MGFPARVVFFLLRSAVRAFVSFRLFSFFRPAHLSWGFSLDGILQLDWLVPLLSNSRALIKIAMKVEDSSPFFLYSPAGAWTDTPTNDSLTSVTFSPVVFASRAECCSLIQALPIM